MSLDLSHLLSGAGSIGCFFFLKPPSSAIVRRTFMTFCLTLDMTLASEGVAMLIHLSSTGEWNDLRLQCRTATTVSQFKRLAVLLDNRPQVHL